MSKSKLLPATLSTKKEPRSNRSSQGSAIKLFPNDRQDVSSEGKEGSEISHVLEDMHDIIESSSHLVSNSVEAIVGSMSVTASLVSKIFFDASECLEKIWNKNYEAAKDSIQCSNALDILTFHHKLYESNYGLYKQYGIQYGEHLNAFTSNLSDISTYSFTNNWVSKLKNKKSQKQKEGVVR